MKPFFCFFLLSVFLSVFHGSQGKDLIHDVCTQITEDDKDLKYDFCQRTLHAIPAQKRPNMEQLCLASIGLVATNIWETRQEITQALQEKINHNGYTEDVLYKCDEYYSDAISLSNDAMESLRQKKYNAARVKVTDALNKANACLDIYEGRVWVSPWKEKCEDLRKYHQVTVDIIVVTATLHCMH